MPRSSLQYQWVPATASSGTQLFELRQVRAPLQSFSSSLFLTLRFPDPSESVRFAIGAGPTILFGDGSGKLSQWTANLFLSPGSTFSENKLYLTAGIGFRLYNRPVGGERGRRRAEFVSADDARPAAARGMGRDARPRY